MVITPLGVVIMGSCLGVIALTVLMAACSIFCPNLFDFATGICRLPCKTACGVYNFVHRVWIEHWMAPVAAAPETGCAKTWKDCDSDDCMNYGLAEFVAPVQRTHLSASNPIPLPPRTGTSEKPVLPPPPAAAGFPFAQQKCPLPTLNKITHARVKIRKHRQWYETSAYENLLRPFSVVEKHRWKPASVQIDVTTAAAVSLGVEDTRYSLDQLLDTEEEKENKLSNIMRRSSTLQTLHSGEWDKCRLWQKTEESIPGDLEERKLPGERSIITSHIVSPLEGDAETQEAPRVFVSGTSTLLRELKEAETGL
eukprot:scpid88209/ scgid7795/ 